LHLAGLDITELRLAGLHIAGLDIRDGTRTV